MKWLPFRVPGSEPASVAGPAAAEPPARPRPNPTARSETAEAGAKTPGFSLDAIGERDEVVRERIDAMVDRLEDMKSLQEHFSSILQPLAAIVEELPLARTRIVELEASLAQEHQAGSAARREAVDLASRVSAMGNDLTQALARLARAETDQAAKDATVEELRIAARDRAMAIDNLERQLFAETEKTKSLSSEAKSLRAEVQSLDQSLTRVDHELTVARERIGLFDQENTRLQQLSEDQNVRLADLGARHDEVVATSTAEREKLRAIEAQLAAEIADREKIVSQYEAVIAASRTERASLDLKLEAALNRATATEHLLGQLRNQIREKDEAARIAERALKEAGAERTSAERRLEAVQIELSRQTERFLDMQRLRGELDSRCDMLTKALAAKDAGLEQVTSRNTAMADRLDQVTKKHEAERLELDKANRRLLEELQKERSERLMAQGALNIARDSRLALQKQHEALKRSSRGWGGEAVVGAHLPDTDAIDEKNPQDSNVRSFTLTGKTS